MGAVKNSPFRDLELIEVAEHSLGFDYTFGKGPNKVKFFYDERQDFEIGKVYIFKIVGVRCGEPDCDSGDKCGGT